MTKRDLIDRINKLDYDELIDLKNSIITNVDKKKYVREVLSSLSVPDAIAMIKWLKEKYGC